MEQFLLENPDLNLPLLLGIAGVLFILFLVKALSVKQDLEDQNRQKEFKVIIPKPYNEIRRPMQGSNTIKKPTQTTSQQSNNKKPTQQTPIMDDQTRANVNKLKSMKEHMSADEFKKILAQTGLDKFFK